MLKHQQSFSKAILAALLFSLGLAFTVKYLHAEIYVWTDENGNKVYGDEPQKSDQAKPVKVEPLTILSFPKIADKEAVDAPQNTINSYTAFSIISPVNDETIRDNTGSVSINLSSEPTLAEGHKIQIFLNGAPYQSPQSSTSFTINNVDRGTHTVSAQLIDPSGKGVMQTQGITFHLHRFSVSK